MPSCNETSCGKAALMSARASLSDGNASSLLMTPARHTGRVRGLQTPRYRLQLKACNQYVRVGTHAASRMSCGFCWAAARVAVALWAATWQR